ncbi:MAG TPA: HAD family hydrolase [Blastocatellia bacterium]|nr:HAD family hydrolase [Blastocatellia bacterium]
MKIKAISFDFWNTLFTEEPGAFRLYQESRFRVLREAVCACGDFTDDNIERAFMTESEEHYRIWCNEHRTVQTAERVGRILTLLEACLPDDVMEDMVKAFEEGVLERPPVLIPGAREAVESLSARYRLGIISDVGYSPGRVLREVIRQNDLLDAFDSLIFSDEAGRSKPHVEVFERAARLLDAAPDEIVHIGDLERTDIVGAKLAGCRAIRFTGITPLEPHETTVADFVTADLSEVPRLIEELGG